MIDAKMTNVTEIASPILEIRNSRLKVEVATPMGNIQRGTRFDLTGHVIQVTLDGIHTFCVPEAFNESRDTGGLGLCNEFVGFGKEDDKASKVGQPYPKLGIGILEYTGEGEGLFSKRLVRVPFPMKVSYDGSNTDIPDKLDLLTEPVSCDGYAMRLHKNLSLEGNSLNIRYQAENTGARTIVTCEYNHNFLQVDSHQIGPEYILKFPYDITIENAPDIIFNDRNAITLKTVPPDSFICFPTGYTGTGHMWELLHMPSGVAIREYDDFAVFRIVLWGRKHVISPEIYYRIELKPGQKAVWNRRYEFFVN